MTVTADLLKPDSSALSALALGLGILELLLTLPCIVAPAPMARAWRAFPRSVWPGRLLAAVALVWAALWLQAMPLGPVAPLKRYLPVLTPVAIIAVALLVDELLSCRALGALMVLIPAPLLSAAQWHPSPWRYVVLVAAYVIAVCGMYMVAAPYRFRDALEWATQSPGRLRLLASLEAAFGVLLIVLALTAYRLP
jgi:hypothetical protein